MSESQQGPEICDVISRKRYSYMCLMVGCSDMLKFTEGSWQGSLTVNNEIAV